MKPARLPWAALLLIVAAACSRPASVFRGAPVVLICVDTLRADRLPAYGYGKVATPALDLLARDSIVFDNAISHVPLTLPSHVSLFTGLLPFQHGVRDNLGFRLSDSHPTLASILRKSGYAAGGAVSAVVLDRGSGVSQGFDYWEDSIEARDVAQAIGQVQRPGDETARLLEKWIGGQPDGGKFLAFLHLYEPHSPYEPPEPFRARTAESPTTERSPRRTRSSAASSTSSRRKTSTTGPSSSFSRITARAWATTARTSTESSSTGRRSGSRSS